MSSFVDICQRQPQHQLKLVNERFWRLVDIQGMPLLGTAAASVTSTLKGSTKQNIGRAGKCIDFVVDGDWQSYGENSALQLATMTGLAVVEVPSSPSERSVILNTHVGGAFSRGFVITVDSNGAIFALMQDVIGIATTTKKVKLDGISAVAWSYNNISGRMRIAVDGVLESFTYADNTFVHGQVGRNQYYENNPIQARHHRQYLFALSAESDSVADGQLVDWSSNPWSIFKQRKPYLVAAEALAGGSSQELTPAAAIATATANDPALTAGAVSISPSAPSVSATVGSSSFTAGTAALAPSAAAATAGVDTPTLTNGAASLSPSAAAATAGADSPSLVAGAVNIASSPAIAAAQVSDGELTTNGSVLTPQAAISTAGADNPSLTAGIVALAPSAAAATAGATDPSLTNGAQLAPSAAAAVAAANNPTLTAGAASFTPSAAAATASAGNPSLAAGGVQLSASAAVASAVVNDPDITSGKQVASVPAAATAGAGLASFIAGLVSVSVTSAESSAAAPSPTLTAGQMSLLPAAAFATAVSSDGFFADGGMQWNAEMLYTISAEDRSFTIAAEDREYSVPAV